MCPELAEALKRSMAKTPANADDLAFLTEDGHPLVHGKTDTIRLTWERCLSTAPAGVRCLPFGRVKKCGAQVVKNVGGREMLQLFLAQRRTTVADVHYAGDDVAVGVGKRRTSASMTCSGRCTSDSSRSSSQPDSMPRRR